LKAKKFQCFDFEEEKTSTALEVKSAKVFNALEFLYTKFSFFLGFKGKIFPLLLKPRKFHCFRIFIFKFSNVDQSIFRLLPKWSQKRVFHDCKRNLKNFVLSKPSIYFTMGHCEIASYSCTQFVMKWLKPKGWLVNLYTAYGVLWRALDFSISAPFLQADKSHTTPRVVNVIPSSLVSAALINLNSALKYRQFYLLICPYKLILCIFSCKKNYGRILVNWIYRIVMIGVWQSFSAKLEAAIFPVIFFYE